MRLQTKSTVGPQQPLRAEAMWSLDERNQQRGAQSTDAGDLLQAAASRIFSTLRQELTTCLLPQRSEQIKLLMERVRPASETVFRQLLQPCGAITSTVDTSTTTRDRLAAIQGLDA